MTDKEFVLSVYQNAVCANWQRSFVIWMDNELSMHLISRITDSENAAWKSAADEINEQVLKKLER